MEEEGKIKERQYNSVVPNKVVNFSGDLPLANADKIEFNGRLTIHITIIGKKKCGKSALIQCYLKKSFENEKQDTTLDIFGKKILIMGHEVGLVLSEVSQDKVDYQLSKEIIGVSHIVFICYSLEDDIEKLNEEIIEGSIGLIQTLKKDIPIFIVGCKFDLIKEESIDTIKIINNNVLTFNGKNIKEYINHKRDSLKNNFCGYYITSSLLNLNIQELFNDAIRMVAMPIVLKHQSVLNDLNLELNKQKLSNNKKKKGENKEENTKIELEIDENGCLIF